MDERFLTLFTPTYNRVHTLHRVYESICNQTLQKKNGEYLFEWIVVDDGSTDETEALIERWKTESEFPIIYIRQENRGKAAAALRAIPIARGELFLFADSDDRFVPETVETFYDLWMGLTAEERKRCDGIGVLCQDQHGNRIGNDYPIVGRLVPTEEAVFKWRKLGLGETWAVLKTDNLRKSFVIPEEARGLRFIPESFFWSRIAFEAGNLSLFCNKILRIYYREGASLSTDIRDRYPESFFFESKWFVTHYPRVLFKQPGLYLKHLLKYLYYSFKVNRTIKTIF
ncbi:glycosyltransferase family 2 protein [Nitratifractor sp.]|uniref:glycosyltransferase family A protein n=1 Tax=Nitratifractor sp. TaxID=2268144 RepID=UPI0025ED790F|nr:glycosyltransferase family 2 protein [Nitratifractor sp.]